jgi:hypothetical protein
MGITVAHQDQTHPATLGSRLHRRAVRSLESGAGGCRPGVIEAVTTSGGKPACPAG